VWYWCHRACWPGLVNDFQSSLPQWENMVCILIRKLLQAKDFVADDGADISSVQERKYRIG
jgi:hypothetical protein